MEKEIVEGIKFNEVYSEIKKKREKIVIHNTDGTTEEYKSGILFTLEEVYNKEEEQRSLRLTAKHCDTYDLQEAYIYGLAQIVTAMIEREDLREKMFHE